jgi:hypothetical protein
LYDEGNHKSWLEVIILVLGFVSETIFLVEGVGRKLEDWVRKLETMRRSFGR